MRRLVVILVLFALVVSLAVTERLEWVLVPLEALHLAHLPFAALAIVAFVIAPIQVRRRQRASGPVQVHDGRTVGLERVHFAESRVVAAAALVTCAIFAALMTWLAHDAWRMSQDEPVRAKVAQVLAGRGPNGVQVSWRDTSTDPPEPRYARLTDEISRPTVGEQVLVRISTRDPSLATPADVNDLRTFTLTSILLWVVAALLALQVFRLAVVVQRPAPSDAT